MASVTRGFCRSLIFFSRQRSQRNLNRVCARFMGQYTKAVMPTIKTPEQAKAFVLHLDDRARILLKDQLHEITKREVIQDLIGEMDELVGLGDEEGEHRSEEEAEKQQKAKFTVSRTELKEVAVFNGLPFVGFGFLDNLIMILAGEWIDMSLGVALGISTMAAAGLGNLISDIAGVMSQSWTESVSGKIGVKAPNLTKEQAQLKSTKYATMGGRIIGISIGCLLGMFPLIFFPDREEKEKIEGDKREALDAAEEKARYLGRPPVPPTRGSGEETGSSSQSTLSSSQSVPSSQISSQSTSSTDSTLDKRQS